MRKIWYPIQFDGTLIIIRDYKSIMSFDYEAWAVDNCKGKVRSDNYGPHRLFVFENSDEAMAFKLTFG